MQSDSPTKLPTRFQHKNPRPVFDTSLSPAPETNTYWCYHYPTCICTRTQAQQAWLLSAHHLPVTLSYFVRLGFYIQLFYKTVKHLTFWLIKFRICKVFQVSLVLQVFQPPSNQLAKLCLVLLATVAPSSRTLPILLLFRCIRWYGQGRSFHLSNYHPF